MSSLQERIISFSGPDAGAFLQAQLTQDIGDGQSCGGKLAAWCSAKGRVIALGRLLELGNGAIGLSVGAAVADRAIQGLQRFRLRSNVEIGFPASPWGTSAVADDASFAALHAMGFDKLAGFNRSQRVGQITAVNIGTASPVIEIYGPVELLAALQKVTTLLASEHALARIHAGIPQLDDTTSEKFTPHMLNLDLLGAVSFDKGCYPGQEIVARTHYLGDSRRRLGRFRLVGDETPTPGDKLILGEDCKVDVVNAVDREILAVAPASADPEPAIATRLELPYAP